jgi:hypothetical protein
MIRHLWLLVGFGSRWPFRCYKPFRRLLRLDIVFVIVIVYVKLNVHKVIGSMLCVRGAGSLNHRHNPIYTERLPNQPRRLICEAHSWRIKFVRGVDWNVSSWRPKVTWNTSVILYALKVSGCLIVVHFAIPNCSFRMELCSLVFGKYVCSFR